MWKFLKHGKTYTKPRQNQHFMKIAMEDYVSVAMRPAYLYGAIDMNNASSYGYKY